MLASFVRFGSCKRSAEKHSASSVASFDAHVGTFLQTKVGRRFSGWRIERALFAPAFSAEQRATYEAEGRVCRDLNDFARFSAATVEWSAGKTRRD